MLNDILLCKITGLMVANSNRSRYIGDLWIQPAPRSKDIG